MAKQIIAPCIHLNGTSKDDLLANLEDAHIALGNAYDNLRRCAPNGRDYYVYDGTAINRAADEHYDRLLRIHSVREEIEELVGAINDCVRFANVKQYFDRTSALNVT